MSKIVGIRSGTVIAHPGKPDSDVVSELETLLEKARAGEIIGVAWAAMYYDGISGNHFVGQCCRSQAGSLFAVACRMNRQLDEA